MHDASPWLPRPRLVPRHDGAAPSTSRLVSMASPSPERPRRGAPRAPVPAAIILLRLKSRVAKPSPCPRIRPVLPSAVAVELVGVVLVPSSPGDPSWTYCCRQVPPAGVPAPAPRPSEPRLLLRLPARASFFIMDVGELLNLAMVLSLDSLRPPRPIPGSSSSTTRNRQVPLRLRTPRPDQQVPR